MTLQTHALGAIKALLEDTNWKNPQIVGLSNEQFKVKKEDESDLLQLNYASAFLGPSLWDRSLDKSDFNLEYMDLDEFLSENGVPISGDDDALRAGKTDNSSCGLSVTDPMPASTCQFPHSPHQQMKIISPSLLVHYQTCIKQINNEIPSSGIPFAVDYEVSEQDLALASIPGEQNFDPRIKNFTEEELKPQPVIKKSKKIFVPEELKDEKYWNRRHKNNFAARRSRDARRVKENQIAMRAAFLEKQNLCLHDGVTKLRKENDKLKEKVAKYESTLPVNCDLLLP